MVQTTINDLFRKTKQDWLEEARDSARKLLMMHDSITIEDVLEMSPRPGYLHRNVTGSVFQTDEFEPVGFTHSRRTASHSRIIRKWTLKNITSSDFKDLTLDETSVSVID